MTERVSDASSAQPAECYQQAMMGLIRLSKISDCPERISCVSRWVLLNLIFYTKKNQHSLTVDSVESELFSKKIGLKFGAFKKSIYVLLDCQILIKEEHYFNTDVVRVNPVFLEKLAQKRFIELKNSGDILDPIMFLERSIRSSDQATDHLSLHHFIQDVLMSDTVTPMTPSLNMVLIVMLLHLSAEGVCSGITLDVMKYIINIDRTMFYRCVEQLQNIGLIRVTIQGSPKQKMFDALPAIYVMDLSHELFVTSKKFYDFFILQYPMVERAETDHFYHYKGMTKPVTLLAQKYWFNPHQESQESQKLMYQQYEKNQLFWGHRWYTQLSSFKPSEYVSFQDENGQEVELLNDPISVDLMAALILDDQSTTEVEPTAQQKRLKIFCVAMQAHLERIAPCQMFERRLLSQFGHLGGGSYIQRIVESKSVEKILYDRLDKLFAKTGVPSDRDRLSLYYLLMVLTANLMEFRQAITMQFHMINNVRLSVLPSNRTDNPCRILYRLNPENTSNKFFMSSVDVTDRITSFREVFETQLEVETQKNLGIRSSESECHASKIQNIFESKPKKQRRKHSREFKQSIVDSIRSEKQTIQKVCDEHQLDRSVVHRWLQDAPT